MGTSPRALITGLGYLALFVLGAVQGVIGSFQYSRSPAPLFAILLVLILFATCVLAGWGMLRPAGALTPAIGWFVASFVLASGTKGGSVIITNTAAGKWFLFGGSAAAAAGTVAAFVLWSGAARQGRRQNR